MSVGTGGPGLFSDDTATDVRDAYREALEDRAGDAEAEAAVLQDSADELADSDDAVIVWLARRARGPKGKLNATFPAKA